MVFFPYRAQIKLHKLPVGTIAVSVACLVIFYLQDRNVGAIERYTLRYCAGLTQVDKPRSGAERPVRAAQVDCARTLLQIYLRPGREAELAKQSALIAKVGGEAAAEEFRAHYRSFAAGAPGFLTGRLWLERPSWNPWRLISSAFAHGSWDHVVFNVIFFFAFAATVELLIGPVLFLAAIGGLSLGIGSLDSLITVFSGDHRPTLGLSGVVMGMLALFVFFVPKAKIRFFYWILFSVGSIGIPAWIVAVWYVGWDLYYTAVQAKSAVNFIAHLGGAALGFAVGLAVFREKRHWANELVVEQEDPLRETTALKKFTTLLGLPGLLILSFLSLLIVGAFIAYFLQNFWMHLLIAAPIAAAGWQVYRMRRAQQPDWARYKLGADALARRDYEEALRQLKPLAEQGYPRALAALGLLYASATGALKNDREALRYFRAAATRGEPEGLYRLGQFTLEGRGTGRPHVEEAVEWMEKAAKLGHVEAANSLGYLYEHGSGTLAADAGKAMQWYTRAALGFHKAGRREDAAAVLRALESLAARIPAAQAAVEKLRAVIAPAAAT